MGLRVLSFLQEGGIGFILFRPLVLLQLILLGEVEQEEEVKILYYLFVGKLCLVLLI